MSWAMGASLADAYREACALDVASLKPGNVSALSPGHGMVAMDFLRSARCSAGPLVAAGSTLGERVLGAVEATSRQLACNTNLGIVLLIAPLVQAIHDYPQADLRNALGRALQRSSVADASAVYRAIRLAAPGGLGEAARHDVAGEPGVTLRTAMSEARTRDMIARQYAGGYREVFEVAVPYLAGAVERHRNRAMAMSDLFLHLLSRYPDSHVARKHGDMQARRVCDRAMSIHERFAVSDPSARRSMLREFDLALKSRSINPGTTADLCVATCFIHRLREQAVVPAGPAPDHLRIGGPGRADAPRYSNSQASVRR